MKRDVDSTLSIGMCMEFSEPQNASPRQNYTHKKTRTFLREREDHGLALSREELFWCFTQYRPSITADGRSDEEREKNTFCDVAHKKYFFFLPVGLPITVMDS